MFYIIKGFSEHKLKKISYILEKNQTNQKFQIHNSSYLNNYNKNIMIILNKH